MSANEWGPRYYYNDPSGTPYHDPEWYRGKKDDDKNKEQIQVLFDSIEEVYFKSSTQEILTLK